MTLTAEALDQIEGLAAMGVTNGSQTLSLIAEVRRLQADAEMFRLLVSTCDALYANRFDKDNQPGTLRATFKHTTDTYPELQNQIRDFFEGFKERVKRKEEGTQMKEIMDAANAFAREHLPEAAAELVECDVDSSERPRARVIPHASAGR